MTTYQDRWDAISAIRGRFCPVIGGCACTGACARMAEAVLADLEKEGLTVFRIKPAPAPPTTVENIS